MFSKFVFLLMLLFMMLLLILSPLVKFNAAIHADDKDSVEDPDKPGFVVSCILPLQDSIFYVGNEKQSKTKVHKSGKITFLEKIATKGRDLEFEEDDLTQIRLKKGNMHIFTGDFPHGGGGYTEENWRLFFRIYSDNRHPGKHNSDQHYFEKRPNSNAMSRR